MMAGRFRILLSADPFIAVPPDSYGGIERIIAALIGALRQRGYEVGLVAHPESRVPVDYFTPWPRISPQSAAAHCRNIRTLQAAVAEFKPSLVHSFSRLLYLTTLLPSRLPKIMSYQRLPGGRQISLAAMLGGRSLRFSGCSEFIAGKGRDCGGTWTAIPNFVDTKFYHFSAMVAADAPLVFLGRIESIKGPHIAIDVAKRTGRRLVLAGTHAESGREGDYWHNRIRPETGKDGIEYVGAVDDLAKNELLGAAAAMIVPVQWDEPFGIVFAEALACGTPVISCPRGAVPEIIRQGIDGFLASDVEAACRAVQSIPIIDRHQCRLRAEHSFSAGAIVPRYERLYQSFLASNTSGKRP